MKKLLFLLLLLPLSAPAQIITTIAGCDSEGYTGDGASAIVARLSYPSTIAFDATGNVYFSDKNNEVIRKINTAGIISTVAGNASTGYIGDGGPATSASFDYPWAVAADDTGNLYIADRVNNVVRKVDTAGIITTFAGNGYGAGMGVGHGGYSGDGGPADSAELYWPSGVAVDNMGNVYIADSYNNVIRKVNTAGVITTFAGNHVAGYSGNGGSATAASISDPYGIAFDVKGNVYIADRNNFVIRKVDTTGIITTFAGNGTNGYSGDGGPATAAQSGTIYGVAVDDSGNVYFSDVLNSVIRKVNNSGTISTYAGTGVAGNTGNGGPATAARLDYPLGISIDASGNLYIADDSSSTIRRISPGTSAVTAVTLASVLQVFPNPTTTHITIQSTDQPINQISINNLLGQTVFSQLQTANCKLLTIDVSTFPPGLYFVQVNGSEVRKFVKE